jgi:hypothetical protein
MYSTVPAIPAPPPGTARRPPPAFLVGWCLAVAAGQIYGAANEANFWYDVSASVYSWLAYKWGLRFAVQTALLSYTGKTTPFNSVVKSNSGNKLVFEDGRQMRTQWASWLRQQIR